MLLFAKSLPDSSHKPSDGLDVDVHGMQDTVYNPNRQQL